MSSTASVPQIRQPGMWHEHHNPIIQHRIFVHPNQIILPILDTAKAEYDHDVSAPLSKLQAENSNPLIEG
jgi:hypothetical protein